MASLTFVVALAVLTIVSSTKYHDKGKVNIHVRHSITKSYHPIMKYACNYFISEIFHAGILACVHNSVGGVTSVNCCIDNRLNPPNPLWIRHCFRQSLLKSYIELYSLHTNLPGGPYNLSYSVLNCLTFTVFLEILSLFRHLLLSFRFITKKADEFPVQMKGCLASIVGKFPVDCIIQ